VHRRRPPDGIILDMDRSESPTFGEQEGSAWNGHFGCTCYHPLFVFNQFGELERCALRPGNVHSAVYGRSPLCKGFRGEPRQIGADCSRVSGLGRPMAAGLDG
jgi:hypothetical protein